MIKAIFLLCLYLAAVTAQAPQPSTVTVSQTTSDSISNSVSTSWSNSVSTSWSNSVSTSWSNSVSITVSITGTVSITTSSSPSGTITPVASPSPSASTPVSCGNGNIDAGEDCDFGTTKPIPNACCNSKCQFKHNGARCRKAAGVCKSRGRCFLNRAATTPNRVIDCIPTRNNPNGSGCPITVNGTIYKGFCTNGVCRQPRRLRV